MKLSTVVIFLVTGMLVYILFLNLRNKTKSKVLKQTPIIPVTKSLNRTTISAQLKIPVISNPIQIPVTQTNSQGALVPVNQLTQPPSNNIVSGQVADKNFTDQTLQSNLPTITEQINSGLIPFNNTFNDAFSAVEPDSFLQYEKNVSNDASNVSDETYYQETQSGVSDPNVNPETGQPYELGDTLPDGTIYQGGSTGGIGSGN